MNRLEPKSMCPMGIKLYNGTTVLAGSAACKNCRHHCGSNKETVLCAVEPFTIKRAKELETKCFGKHLKTKDGRNAHVICWDLTGEHGGSDIIVQIYPSDEKPEEFLRYDSEGRCVVEGINHNRYDLFLEDREATFEATLEYVVHKTVTVVAETEKEAAEVIKELEPESIFESETIKVSELEDLQIVDIQKL